MRKRKNFKKMLGMVLAGSLVLGSITAGNAEISEAAQSVFLKSSQMDLHLSTKKTAKIKVKKVKGVTLKKVTYKSKDKKVAVVSKSGKITAKSAGSTKIIVSVKFKKKEKTLKKALTCKVTVKADSKISDATPSPSSSSPEPQQDQEPEVSENGDIRAVKAVLPKLPSVSSDETELIGEDDSWRQEAAKWKEKEKPVDMRKYYKETLKCFLSDEKNTVYSPINVYLALSVLAETGNGETRSEILDLLQVEDTETLREHIHALWNANYYESSSATSLLGNSVWLNNRVDYNEDLLKTLAKYYYASSFSGTMGSENFNQEIRNWVNEYTKDLLKDSVQDIKMYPDTVMDIISTIYFKAGWIDSFSKSATKKEIFHGKSGDKTVEMMHRSAHGRVYQTDKFTGLSLGLSAGKMHFILPKEGVSLSEVVADDDMLEMVGAVSASEAKGNGRVESGSIRMSIPKFKLHSKISLVNGLKSLGITGAFDAGAADFRSLFAESSELNGVVSEVSHAAMVQVDEDGVTGAAYTEIMMKATSALETNVIEFVLDRPFYYVVTADDGSILFAGTAYDL